MSGRLFVIVITAGFVGQGYLAPRQHDHVDVVRTLKPAVRALSASAETEGERNIRTQILEAFANDTLLRDSRIAVHVCGSDILLDGTVQNEAARQRTNDIVMAIPGIRSVSNGLQLAE